MADKILGFLGDLVKPANGGASGGGWRFFDISGLGIGSKRDWMVSGYSVKLDFSRGGIEIIGCLEAINSDLMVYALAVAIPLNCKMYTEGEWYDNNKIINDLLDWAFCPEITEEEFYSL